MATAISPPEAIQTLADLLERLGGIPLERIRFRPAPGTATEDDVIQADCHEDRLCELVDGVLVEKGMGLRESLLAGAIIAALRAFAMPRNLGVVSGESGTMRLLPGLVRIPDVAFISWDRLPGGQIPSAPIPPIAPDIAVEVVSESNTRAEMARKRREYFEAGTRLVWEVDPRRRSVAVYTSPDESVILGQDDALSGGEVLPGFELPLRELFAELDRIRGE